jgi:hypothetical protein
MKMLTVFEGLAVAGAPDLDSRIRDAARRELPSHGPRETCDLGDVHVGQHPRSPGREREVS